MPAATGVTNFLKKNSSYIAKGVGLAALGIIGYDSHYIGKMQSDLYASEKDADSSLYYLNNDMYSTNMSKVEDIIKDKSLQMELDQGWKRFFNTGIGYVKGFTSMLVYHAVPFALGTIALLKGSKLCAGALGVVGVYKFLKNFFGWGTPNGLTK